MTGNGRAQNVLESRFSDRVRAVRELRGWTHEELARRASSDGHVRLNRMAISRIEAKSRGVGLGEAAELARALEVPLDAMLFQEHLVLVEKVRVD